MNNIHEDDWAEESWSRHSGMPDDRWESFFEKLVKSTPHDTDNELASLKESTHHEKDTPDSRHTHPDPSSLHPPL